MPHLADARLEGTNKMKMTAVLGLVCLAGCGGRTGVRVGDAGAGARAEGGGLSVSYYAPCHGEPGACASASVMGDTSGREWCICILLCDVDSDCPTTSTGTAVPICKPFGDVVENGETGSCSLPCGATVTCPDRMKCNDGECWEWIGS